MTFDKTTYPFLYSLTAYPNASPSLSNAVSDYQMLLQVQSEVEELVDYIANFESTVLAQAKAYTDGKVEYLSEVVKELQGTVANNFYTLNAKIDSINTSIRSDLNTLIANTRNDLQAQIDEFFTMISNVQSEGKNYTDSQVRLLEAKIDSLDFNNFKIVNPYTGMKENINKVLMTIAVGKGNGITYAELSNLKMTYKELSNKHITYNDLSFDGKKKLGYPEYGMIDPWTGKFVEVREVVYKLTFPRPNAITYKQLSDKHVTYSQLTAKHMTYYDFSFIGAQYFA